jgi:hypothetical protein
MTQRFFPKPISLQTPFPYCEGGLTPRRTRRVPQRAAFATVVVLTTRGTEATLRKGCKWNQAEEIICSRCCYAHEQRDKKKCDQRCETADETVISAVDPVPPPINWGYFDQPHTDNPLQDQKIVRVSSVADGERGPTVRSEFARWQTLSSLPAHHRLPIDHEGRRPQATSSLADHREAAAHPKPRGVTAAPRPVRDTIGTPCPAPLP